MDHGAIVKPDHGTIVRRPPRSGDSPRSGNREPTASPTATEGVILTPYEASRLQNIERNNKKLQDLGLPALVSQVGGAEKAGKEILTFSGSPWLFLDLETGGLGEEGNAVQESSIPDASFTSSRERGAFCYHICTDRSVPL